MFALADEFEEFVTKSEEFCISIRRFEDIFDHFVHRRNKMFVRMQNLESGCNC